MKEAVRVFRLHVRPSGGLADHALSFGYCLEKGILGIGWPIDPPSEGVVTWELYEKLALEEYSSTGLSSVRLLHEQVRPHDLIWTRDTNGRYYLAQVQSPWKYLDTEDGRNADIVNVVRCEIEPVEKVDDAPGKIVACFIPRKAFQPIKNLAMVSYSQLLWNQLTKSEDYPPQARSDHNIFTYLSWETTEDVIFIYLQIQGWLVISHSRKANTMSYEFVAIHRDTSERAIVQVKTGNTELNRDDWKDYPETVFLFQANGKYCGSEAPKNVICLMPNDIEKFIRANLRVMPGAVQRWVRHLESSDTQCQ